MEPDEMTIQAAEIAAAFYETKRLLRPEHGMEEQPIRWEALPQQKRNLLTMAVRTLIENGVICGGPEASEGALGFSRDQLRGNPDRYRYICEECGYEGDRAPVLDDTHTMDHAVYAVPIREEQPA